MSQSASQLGQVPTAIRSRFVIHETQDIQLVIIYRNVYVFMHTYIYIYIHAHFSPGFLISETSATDFGRCLHAILDRTHRKSSGLLSPQLTFCMKCRFKMVPGRWWWFSTDLQTTLSIPKHIFCIFMTRS